MKFTYIVNENGEATITGYTGRINPNLIIPSEFDGIPVTSIGMQAFSGYTRLESITIPDSVTSIDDFVFSDCTSLESVTIPDSVTSIGDETFYWCTSLKSITIPDSVTSIDSLAFYNTAYYNNESNWENGVLYIGKHLIEAKDTVSGSYTIKDGTKTIASSAFSDCESLVSVTIPDSVTSIGEEAFYNCTSLESVTIPDSVTSIGHGAFSNCKSLASIAIPDSVTSIGKSAFYNCTSLASITIPDSVTSIGKYAFYNCTSLASEAKNYKAFKLKNNKLFCLNYEFKETEWSDEVSDIEMCERGYHFCTNLFELFDYYSGTLDEDIAIYECGIGDKVVGYETSKCVTNKIKPVKRLTRVEVIKILNGGKLNENFR